MTAQDAVRRNKTTLQDILSADYKRILCKVFENRLVTRREYNNLRDISGEDVEGHIIRLVDRVMNKGEDTCRTFLHLLRTDEDIENTFPELKRIQWDYTSTPFQSYTDSAPCGPPYPEVYPVLNRDVPVQESKRRKEDNQYQLTSKPTGLCVIINNENFKDGTKRNGTNKDAQSLAEVFSWLGFRVVMCKDQTKNQMDQALKRFSSLRDLSQLQEFSVKEWSGSEFIDLKELPQHGDAFICCILSHGQMSGISGIDKNLLSVNEITSPFNGANCSVLINKPKVFFIQACQGGKKQRGVAAPVRHLDADTCPVYERFSIPEEADFLVAIASVEDYQSFRHTTDGSWFIQSLCQQLKESCPR
ncbi:caspase-3-like [Diretmus argenteus]